MYHLAKFQADRCHLVTTTELTVTEQIDRLTMTADFISDKTLGVAFVAPCRPSLCTEDSFSISTGSFFSWIDDRRFAETKSSN